MNVIEKFKEWWANRKSIKMLESGEKKNYLTKSAFKKRIDAKGIAGQIEKYKELMTKIVELDKAEDKCVTDFYDSLVEAFNLGHDYSQENLNKLKNRQVELQERLNRINENLIKDGRERWESEVYQKVYREKSKGVLDIASIEDKLAKCMKQMEKEYEKNPLKFKGANQIYIQLAEVITEKYKALASCLAIEYSMLEKITQQGDMSPEQRDIIEAVMGRKIVSMNIPTFLGKRLTQILECVDPTKGGLSNYLIDDGGTFHKVEAIFNDIIFNEVLKAFEKTKEEASSSLSENVDFEAIGQLYSIYGNAWGLLPKETGRPQSRENARQYE